MKTERSDNWVFETEDGLGFFGICGGLKTECYDCISNVCNPVGVGNFYSIVFMPSGFKT